MELRDFFAGAALTGMLSHEATELLSSKIDELVPYMYEVYNVADAMVAARSAKISEQGETEKPTANTDYTAALEWEITQFLTDRNIYDGETETLELAKRLNSVVKKQQQNCA